jgi:hypothetical protein
MRKAVHEISAVERDGVHLKVNLGEVKFSHAPVDVTSLKFKPKAFVVETPKLEGKIIEASVQANSFQSFTDDPTVRQTYICSGNPDATKARYFALYLASVHQQYMVENGRRPNILWESVVGGFDNPAMRADDTTLLVIDNLSVIPNKVKYDKVRDLITKFAKIPKILIVEGEDPVSFAAARLFTPVHALAYFPAKGSKTALTII